jgi:uncharacterized membrane protein YcaP (DUF421 family)
MGMESLNEWWGIKDDISILEISARAAAAFFIALILVRFLSMRPFGKGNAYDVIVTFLIGGILSRGVVGATPFFSSVAGAITIMLIHKLIGRITFFSRPLDKVINGEKIVLYKNGNLQFKNMKALDITKSNIYEEVRRQLRQTSLDNVKEIYMEKTGEMSFITE